MSTGRYQSRVFNFLSQQSLRLRDRSTQTWRQVKVAAVWGVQILLYPVYVGFQSTRLVEKQLQQTARQTLPRLRSAGRALQVRKPRSGSALPPVDAPLQNVLQTVQAAPTDAMLQIRGIASQMDTGSLVLVTAQNQILDLDFEQQTELTRRIAWETANYWRQCRLFNPPQPAPISTFLPPVKPRPNALLPIRVLQTLMAWMQRGSVAASADLFQESRLVVYLPSQPALAASKDESILRSAQPSWVAMEAQFYDWLEQAGQATTDLLLAGLKSGQVTFSDIISRFAERLPESPFPDLPAPAPLKKLQLPAAGDWLPILDRWLSKVPGLEQPQLPTSSDPQPWLKMDDLFCQPDPALSSNLEMAQNSKPNLSQPPQVPIQVPVNVWLRRSFGSLLPKRQTVSAENPAVWETTDTAVLETAIKMSRIKFPQPKWMQSQSGRKSNLARPQQSASITPAYPSAMVEFPTDQRLTTPRRIDPLDQEAPLSSLDTANQEEAAMLPQTWIETEARLVEYVKHPLEQLLEWLDKSMLWIETRLAKVWRWLTRPIE